MLLRIHSLCLVLVFSVFSINAINAEDSKVVKLKATADIGLSAENYQGSNERIKSWGLSSTFKLKSIQEMGAIRFDLDAVKGKEIISAKLYLHKATKDDRLRYFRISTVNADWEEGKEKKNYGPPNGACFDYADWDSKKFWAWPNSQFCDVVLGAGYSIASYSERTNLPNDWISIDVPHEIIYAMAIGDSDGLAIQDGGDLVYKNNLIHSVQSGQYAPYLEVSVGGKLSEKVSAPNFKLEPGVEVAKEDSGAIKVLIEPADNVFCWKVKANGEPVGRWQIPHPIKGKAVSFFIEYLVPNQEYEIEIIAVSKGGAVSSPVKAKLKSSVLPSTTISFGEFSANKEVISPLKGGDSFVFWVSPSLVKISPITGKNMFGDMAGEDGSVANSVWNGKNISLFGCKGEYVSCQLVIDKTVEGLDNIAVEISELKNLTSLESTIKRSEIELYKNWYAQNKNKEWQPAYCVPLQHAENFSIPDKIRKLSEQKNQTIYVDVYIPKDAKPGKYTGRVQVKSGNDKVEVPIIIDVFDFDMPDKLVFWPQLNVYSWGMIGEGVLPSYKLAHQHRSVFFYRDFIPKLSGSGKSIKVDWSSFDKQVGPLLSGEAFKDNRRSGVPVEALGLPFKDSWPTNLTEETYKYKGNWILASENNYNKRKGLEKFINEHYMTSPKIEVGLSGTYEDAFVSVEKQFIDHFTKNNWNDTEFQCLFMGKNTHRIQFKVNMWWTTDEPYHWVDWLALEYFSKLWVNNRGKENADKFVFRSDISRPQWQPRFLDNSVDTIHFGTGACSSEANIRRVELLERQGQFKKRMYGAANADNKSNHGSVSWLIGAWINGANAALPWQAGGNYKSLDVNDGSVGGNALIAPAKKVLGVDVVADIRLKAFRDGEQIVEYLNLFAKRNSLSLRQVNVLVNKSLNIKGSVAEGASADNADALKFDTLKDWEISQLRAALAREILKANK